MAPIGLTALIVLPSSCGSSGVTTSPTTERTASISDTAATAAATTATTATTATASIGSCRFRSDRVVPVVDAIQLQAHGAAAPMDVVAPAPLGCGTVRAQNSGVANVEFSSVARCQFQQATPAKVGFMRTREPDGTLLRLVNAQATCTLKNGSTVALCGLGDVRVDGPVNQIVFSCNSDPTFSVAVFGGRARVTGPSGRTFPVGPNKQLDFDSSFPQSLLPSGPAAVPTDAKLTPGERAVFETQARALGLPFTPAATTTTTSSTGTTG